MPLMFLSQSMRTKKYVRLERKKEGGSGERNRDVNGLMDGCDWGEVVPSGMLMEVLLDFGTPSIAAVGY